MKSPKEPAETTKEKAESPKKEDSPLSAIEALEKAVGMDVKGHNRQWKEKMMMI